MTKYKVGDIIGCKEDKDLRTIINILEAGERTAGNWTTGKGMLKAPRQSYIFQYESGLNTYAYVKHVDIDNAYYLVHRKDISFVEQTKSMTTQPEYNNKCKICGQQLYYGLTKLECSTSGCKGAI